MDEPPGSFNICDVCGWEDDHVQLANPRMAGGANRESLVQAQAEVVQRFPIEMQSAKGFERDRSWRPLREDEQLPCGDTPRSSEDYFHAAAAASIGYYWRK